jgi:hypothetical protein
MACIKARTCVAECVGQIPAGPVEPAARHIMGWLNGGLLNRARGRRSANGRIWHETYQVAAGHYEAIYANMPRYGLAVAGTHEPATGHRSDARSRMRSSGA